MSIRTESIAKTFSAWLERYSPPQMMKEKPDVMQAEVETLLRVILKFAPQEGYNGWVDRMLDRLEYQMKTRAWPTKGEVGSICSNMRKETAQSSGVKAPDPKDELQVMADRINAGEFVGDGFLYGRQAVDLLRNGLVSGDTMRKYRSALYFSMKDAWGEEKARQVEATLIAKHDAAERLHSDTAAIEMPKGEPFKRMPKGDWEDVA